MAAVLGPALALGGLYGMSRFGVADPTPAPGPSLSARPAPSPPVEVPATLKASLLADAVAVLNAGPDPVADLRVTLSGDGPEAYVAAAPGTLAPGEEVVLALDGFRPVPPPGWRPRRVEMAPAGVTPLQVELR